MKFSSLFGKPNAVQRERWERMKAKGKKSFVLRVGVLQFGGFMFLAMTLLDFMQKPAFPRQPIDYFVQIVIGLLIWPAGGYLFGHFMWRYYENHFSDSNSTHN